MTSRKNDGGPAYPVIGAPGAKEDFPGKSLRDWFAGMATDADVEQILRIAIEKSLPMTRAEARYVHADLMLKARQQ